MRGEPRGFTDTMHLVLAANPAALVGMMLAAVALGGWFRGVSAAAVLVVAASAVYAFSFAAALDANLPTPGLGLVERIAQYSYQVWQIVLATALMRRLAGAPPPTRGQSIEMAG